MRKHSSIKLALFVIFILSITQIHSFNTLATLKGACSQVNITPPVGTWLSGYSSRDKPSDDIADDLYAKVLVLNDGQTSIALISTDLLWIPLKMTNQIRKIIKENTGINEKNVLICGTHTHFGPKIDRPAKMWPDAENSRIDNAYVETLIKKIGGAVFIAHNSLQEVKIGAAKGEIPEIIYNRRPGKKDGSVQMSYTIPESEALPKPIIRVEEIGRQKITTVIPFRNSELTFGPIDPDVWILKVENTDGGNIGTVVNFACHTLAGSTHKNWFYSISADFPAVTANVIEKSEGGICLFTAGTTGNIVPIKRGKKPRFQIGKALGGEVLRRMQFVHTTGNVTLNAIKNTITFPLKDNPTSQKDADKKYLTTDIQILRIGDTYILGLPGEILVEIGLEIKKQAGLKNLFIISLSNDAIGYVCHNEAYNEGGYEPTSGTTLARGAGEIIIKEALKIINQIK
ncbi:neutral/alkaline non-lysosomal ceramidase N-terminal domain-containing protein [bacterium]|nr:neutral/alkaline non-lysosomal ceramidase N-terminal domain-containing protein [bacterium]